MAKPRVKIPRLVFMSEIKNDLSLKKVKFSISFLLKICNNLVYSNVSTFRTEAQFFHSRFASNLMLLAYLLGIFLVANATEKKLEITFK